MLLQSFRRFPSVSRLGVRSLTRVAAADASSRFIADGQGALTKFLERAPEWMTPALLRAKGFGNFEKVNKQREQQSEGGPSEQPPGDKKPEGSEKAEQSEKSSGGGGDKKPNGDKKKPSKEEVEQQRVQQVGLGVGAAVFLLYSWLSTNEREVEITYASLLNDFILKGLVEKISIVNKSFARVHLSHSAGAHLTNQTYILQLGSTDQFESKLEQAQRELGIHPGEFIPVQYVNERIWAEDALKALPSILFIGSLVIMMRMMSRGAGGGLPGGGGNIFSIGKANVKTQADVKSTTKFADVAGLKHAKVEVKEFVDFLSSPDKYKKLGAKIPKGGILVGPPGTGKTLLAKAVAGEAGVPFFSMSGSDFVEMFVGVGPSRVRDLFEKARKETPSIIFIDEIDAVGRKRGKGGFGGGGNDERENTLNQLLVEMDGFTPQTDIVVLAGTNRIDILDPALLRPGRFDRQIAIEKPDIGEREEIFMVHLKPVTLAEGLDMKDIAQRMASLTPGFSGADIANICNEAAIFAARGKCTGVDNSHFELAAERVLGGLPKNSNLMDAKQKKTVALHESGHAVVGWFLKHADPLLKVSIVPRANGALGFAQYLPEEMALHSKQAIEDKIAVALGGRAAEELFVDEISTGAHDDLDKVTKMAYAMVSTYGMNGPLGLVSFQTNSSENFYKPYSEATGQLIDQEARKIIEAQYDRVKKLLTEKKDLLEGMADALAEKETLVYSDIKAIFGERPWPMKEHLAKFIDQSRPATTTKPASGEVVEEAPAATAAAPA
eukprot:CAMPEP_0204278074 /NCGR_PEP_ID=MMETSP0468-20130131/29659_1 /ASSEMBLY_ACC=CAM_ASM_000383 /TAXON_ID=2969 /ORGANISM="Oxyrrhis marina" /LENGTH=778 /DNA_ID=CAMNT_0051254937 /DNA_START=41 /DNA_END=2377 /DNA_ORIENTATION=+